MPQWELGCVIALPLGNLLNKYLAKQPRGNNSSISLITVPYCILAPTLTGESETNKQTKKNNLASKPRKAQNEVFTFSFFEHRLAKELYVQKTKSSENNFSKRNFTLTVIQLLGTKGFCYEWEMGAIQAFQWLHLNGLWHVPRSFGSFGRISGLTTTLPLHLRKMNVVGRKQRSTSQHKARLSLLARFRRRGTLWFCFAQRNEGPCSGMTAALQSLCLITQEGDLLREQTPTIMTAN